MIPLHKLVARTITILLIVFVVPVMPHVLLATDHPPRVVNRAL
jgi:hypothetical protein